MKHFSRPPEAAAIGSKVDVSAGARAGENALFAVATR